MVVNSSRHDIRGSLLRRVQAIMSCCVDGRTKQVMTFCRTRGKLRSCDGLCDREDIYQGGQDAEKNR